MTLLATWWVGTQCLLYSPSSGIGPVPGTNNITIHGLWAEHNASSYPTCCDTSYTFDSSEIANVTNLQTNWVSSTGSDEKLYAHEWEKHGTCTLDIMPSEYSYFQNVVNLNIRLNMTGMLASAGITAGSSLVSKTKVLAALTSGLGYEPLLECKSVNGQKMLSSIYVCIDNTSSLNVRNCTSDYYSSYSSKCSSSFYLPEIPSDCYK